MCRFSLTIFGTAILIHCKGENCWRQIAFIVNSLIEKFGDVIKISIVSDTEILLTQRYLPERRYML